MAAKRKRVEKGGVLAGKKNGKGTPAASSSERKKGKSQKQRRSSPPHGVSDAEVAEVLGVGRARGRGGRRGGGNGDEAAARGAGAGAAEAGAGPTGPTTSGRAVAVAALSEDARGRIIYNASPELEAVIRRPRVTWKQARDLVWKYIRTKGLLHEEGGPSAETRVEKDALLSRAFKGSIEDKVALRKAVKRHLTLPPSLDRLESDPGAGSAGRRAGRSGALAADPAGILNTIAEEETWLQNESRTEHKRKQGVFSAAEDEVLRRKVTEVARANNLSETDLSWLFKTRTLNYKRKKGVWSQIAAALPHRRARAVYDHGVRLFRRLLETHQVGKWTKEEEATLRSAVADLGESNWKAVSERVGRDNSACRSHWFKSRMGGKMNATSSKAWTEQEISRLKQLVEEFLAKREAAERRGGEGMRMQRDDIGWTEIAKKHGTRNAHQCLRKWYDTLCPSMVTKGQWGHGDDRVLLEALYSSYLGQQEWHVNWDDLVPHRPAQQAKRRWKMMVKYIPDYQDRTFSQQVDFLCKHQNIGLYAISAQE